jgi:hypothetical protein
LLLVSHAATKNWVFNLLKRFAVWVSRVFSNYLHCLFFPALVRPVVLIQSDDWGRIGAPRAESIMELRETGYPVGDSPWDFYGLETKADLGALGQVLHAHEDADGRSAVMTAVFVMANADLRRMREENYAHFKVVPIVEGYPAPWNEPSLVGEYNKLVALGVLWPAMHGYTHFNPRLMLSIAREGTERGRRLRAMHERDVPYLASLTPEFNFALLDRSDVPDRFFGAEEQSQWIENGVQLFRGAFGHGPTSTCAPGYRFNDVTCNFWRQAGITVVHTAGGRFGPYQGVWLTPRNVPFEPVLNANASRDAVAAAARAFRRGEPLVIGTHSINYISRHLGKSALGREQLGLLLTILRSRHPNLRFAHETELYASWAKRDPAWWRRPTLGERFRRLTAGTHKRP